MVQLAQLALIQLLAVKNNIVYCGYTCSSSLVRFQLTLLVPLVYPTIYPLARHFVPHRLPSSQPLAYVFARLRLAFFFFPILKIHFFLSANKSSSSFFKNSIKCVLRSSSSIKCFLKCSSSIKCLGKCSTSIKCSSSIKCVLKCSSSIKCSCSNK